MSEKKHDFDCVDMKHRAAERIRRELEGKSKEERLAYWREVAERQRKLQEETILRG
jgi:hypothetical protein